MKYDTNPTCYAPKTRMHQLPCTPCFPITCHGRSLVVSQTQGSTEVYLRARMRLDAASAGRCSGPRALSEKSGKETS